MATQADVRRIALSLPEAAETRNHFACSVRNKGTEPHYDGFPAVLVRLPAVGPRP